MLNLYLAFIILCFVIQILVWIITGFSNKKTLTKKGGWTLRITAIIILVVLIGFQEDIFRIVPVLHIQLWPTNISSGLVADLVTFIGLLVMLWARKTLGRNWSGNIVLKENHELITAGPYAYVRHPIYTGLTLMILGVAIYNGNILWLAFTAIFFCGAYYKARKEEILLISHFGQIYLDYKARVRALIPFVF
jgi:protein-S-isoprenylcysteine O-methyltransferase